MTEKQIEKTRKQIKKIRAGLAAEKRKFGCYDDSRGSRYGPPKLYVKIRDFKGGLTYLRWFKKNFPDDMAYPDFFFEWAIMLYMNGKIAEAEGKILECYFSNTYVIDAFFGRPLIRMMKIEFSNTEKMAYCDYFDYRAETLELPEFTAWLGAFEASHRFQSVKKSFISLKVALLHEQDPERRRAILRQINQLLEG